MVPSAGLHHQDTVANRPVAALSGAGRWLVLMIGIALLVGLAGSDAAAFGNAGRFGATIDSVTPKAVTPVHRCHRRCRYAWVNRWQKRAFHRHVGPHCTPTLCRRQYRYRPPGWRRMNCIRVGPVWICG